MVPRNSSTGNIIGEGSALVLPAANCTVRDSHVSIYCCPSDATDYCVILLLYAPCHLVAASGPCRLPALLYAPPATSTVLPSILHKQASQWLNINSRAMSWMTRSGLLETSWPSIIPGS